MISDPLFHFSKMILTWLFDIVIIEVQYIIYNLINS